MKTDFGYGLWFQKPWPSKRSRKERMVFKKICEELINCKGTIKASDVQIDQLTSQYKIYERHKIIQYKDMFREYSSQRGHQSASMVTPS